MHAESSAGASESPVEDDVDGMDEMAKIKDEMAKIKDEMAKMKAEKDEMAKMMDEMDAEKEAERELRVRAEKQLQDERARAEQQLRDATTGNSSVKILEYNMDALKEKLRENGKRIYHDEQLKVAKNIARLILEGKVVFHQFVQAPCQSGKTGVILAVIDLLNKECRAGNYPSFDPNCIYVQAMISSTTWSEQMKGNDKHPGRLPECLKKNVFHRGEIKKSLKEKLEKELEKEDDNRDRIVIVDEAHIAASEDMTYDKMLKALDLKDYENITRKRVHFIYISATPCKFTKNIEQWGKRFETHVMQPGSTYMGVEDYQRTGRLFPCWNFYDKTHQERNVDEYICAAVRNPDEPKFHIVRANTRKGDLKNLFEKRIQAIGAEYKIIECNSKSGTKLNDLLEVEPMVHTFIIIKDFSRVAETLVKKYIGTMHDAYSPESKSTEWTQKDDTMLQSLLGRACGYPDPDGENGPMNDIEIYTNLGTVERYINGWKSVKYPNTKTHSDARGYHNIPNDVQLSVKVEDKDEDIDDVVFTNVDDVKSFLKEKKDDMGMKRMPKWDEGDFHKTKPGGFTYTSRMNKGKVINDSDERRFIKGENMPKKSTNISTTEKGQRYFVVPFYETVDTPADQVQYQVRYYKQPQQSTSTSTL